MNRLGLVRHVHGGTVGPKYKRPAVPAPPAFRGADDEPCSWEYARLSRRREMVTGIPGVRGATAHSDCANQQRWSKNCCGTDTPATNAVEDRALATVFRADRRRSRRGCTDSRHRWAINREPTGRGKFQFVRLVESRFLGLYRRRTEAARAQLMAQTWAQRAVRLTVVQQVVANYLEHRVYDALGGGWQ
jgi:multidrug efflux system outer membrane protein